jgi:hypothetical protein
VTENNDIILKEEQIEDKYSGLDKFKLSIPKVVLLVVVTDLVLPYIPLRNGRLINQYGYINGVIFGAIVYILIVPLAILFHIDKIQKEIVDLERDLEILKKLRKLKEE